jgi:hypothetical protein
MTPGKYPKENRQDIIILPFVFLNWNTPKFTRLWYLHFLYRLCHFVICDNYLVWWYCWILHTLLVHSHRFAVSVDFWLVYRLAFQFHLATNVWNVLMWQWSLVGRCRCLAATYCICLLDEDGGSMLLWNVNYLPDYMVSHPRRS